VNGRSTYLQQALAGPQLALLLCGDSRHWDSLQLDRLRERYGRVIATHCLNAKGSDGPLVDEKGNAFARLGVQHTAQYLVRPDGYIAFRSAGRTFEQLDRYLADWYVTAP
jgi:Aromatic-ring hydroxylase, C-terminal